MPNRFYHWYQMQYARLRHLSWGSFKRWYLNPHMRSGRTSFNAILFAAALPGLLLGLGSMAGFLTPLIDMMTLSQHLSGSASGGDLTSISDALQTLQGTSEHIETSGKALGGVNWSSWLNLLIMAALTPLFLGRARDIGIKNVWIPTFLAQSNLITDLIGLVGFPTALGWLAGILSFVVTMWLCTKKSKPIPPKFPVDETINPKNWPPAPYA